MSEYHKKGASINFMIENDLKQKRNTIGEFK